MKILSTLSAIASFAAVAQAHTWVWGLWVNGVFQGDGQHVYVRSPPSNSPVKDVSLLDINCNVNNVAVPQSVTVKGGDTVTFEWYHANRGDDIVDSTHKGPITVYIAKRDTDGNGPVWTKLSEDGYSGGKWGVDRLIANRGMYDVKLPAGLASGDYLLRGELIALHEGDTDYTTNHNRGAQFYPSCSQITVTGDGTIEPPGTFNFVGGYTPETPGILFDLFNGFTSYPIPGPPVWDGTSGSTKPTSSAKYKPTTTPTPKSKPKPTPTPTPTPTIYMNSTNPTPTTLIPSVKPIPYGQPTTYIRSTTTLNPKSEIPQPTYTQSAQGGCPAYSPSPSSSTSGVVQKYYQCGGRNWTGSTTCASGLKCHQWNDFYHQCLDY